MPLSDFDLDLDQLRTRLRDLPVGHTIDYHKSIASTMPRAHEIAASTQAAGGAIVIADEQTAGRGRHERHWESPAGLSLLCSVILKPPFLPAQPALLPMIAGIAVVRAVEIVVPAASGSTWLKWPNDVLLGATPERAAKVAGILIESALDGGALQSAILGIGINVNQTARDLPAVPSGVPAPSSLRLFAGAPLNRADLLVALCTALSVLLILPPAADAIYAQWRDLLITLGRTVTVSAHGATEKAPIMGRAVDVTADGALVVEDAAGEHHIFVAADVSLRSPGA